MTHTYRDRRWPVFDLILIGATIAMVSLAATVFSQEPPPIVAPGPALVPKIDGPSTIATGAELRLSVSNLALPPVTDGFAKLQEWSQKVRIAVDAPDGAKPVTVDSDVAFGLGAQSLRLRLVFSAETPGIYVVILHDGNAGVVAYKRVTVGAGVPVVNPQPGPGPNPNQPGPLSPSAVRKVVLIYEKDQSQVSPQLRQAIHNLNVGSSGVVASVFEVDSTNGGGAIPKQFEAAVKAAKDAGLPALVSLGANDVVLRTVRNPSTEAHLKEVFGQ
ncbi:MAG: hypothetical protein IPJ01_12170 [Micavibrio sp.]|nr:hypothetical protein [Micavibrio sp.]